MIKVSVVEDEPKDAEILVSYLNRYGKEKGVSFDVRCDYSSDKFLTQFSCDRDILFFDIEMPGIDGMTVAKKIRALDKNVIIVFVTNLAQYAIDGYKVAATDFLLKPVRYAAFCMGMNHICNELKYREKNSAIVINCERELISLPVADIYYAEVINHWVFFYCATGTYKTAGPITKYAEKLTPHFFTACNACYLVNMRHIQKIVKNTVYVNDQPLSISKTKRKSFLMEIAKYNGGSI